MSFAGRGSSLRDPRPSRFKAFLPDGEVPYGIPVRHVFLPDGVCNPVRHVSKRFCRTGFATPSVTFQSVFAGWGLQPRPSRFKAFLPDGVCNPVRHVSKRTILKKTLRTGLQTPSSIRTYQLFREIRGAK
jgi:hypothetical protein